MTKINERQSALRLGGNFSNLNDYLDKINVKQMPYAEAQKINVSSANVSAILSGILTGKIFVDGTVRASSNGAIVAPNVTAFTAGTPIWDDEVKSDDHGNILNKLEIRNSTTHDPVIYNDREVFALLQSANGVVDNADIVTTPAGENLQVSFAYIASDGTITSAIVNEEIEFRVNKAYSLRYAKVIELENGAKEQDVIIDSRILRKRNYTVTTATTAGSSNLTLSTGALTNSGGSTPSGDTAFTLSAAEFNSHETLIWLNGVKQLKGTDVTRVGDDTIAITLQLDVDDVIEVLTRK